MCNNCVLYNTLLPSGRTTLCIIKFLPSCYSTEHYISNCLLLSQPNFDETESMGRPVTCSLIGLMTKYLCQHLPIIAQRDCTDDQSNVMSIQWSNPLINRPLDQTMDPC